MKQCGTNDYYPSIRKNLHKSGRCQSFYVFVRRVLKHTLVIIKAYHCWQLHTKLYLIIHCQCCLQVHAKLLGVIGVAFDVKGKLLFLYSAFRYLRKNGNTVGQCISY